MNSSVERTNYPQIIQLPDAEMHFYRCWLENPEANRLLHHFQQRLRWQQPQIRMFGKLIKIPRMQAWYGEAEARYRYSGLWLEPIPWEPELLALQQRLRVDTGSCFNAVLANWYRNGNDSMGWHSDDEPELGVEPAIASINLGASRRFQMRHRNGAYKFELELSHGSLLLMTGSTQHHWQHAIPKQKKVTDPRINLTFRSIRGDENHGK
ncbi:alpha-ketoglutarate-dependent dioxygenase AlkB family protein [Corallincola holothuriorum]|nr:alpha-ketoglutarate-dependent dioxygenase AlkB [Corallincola holothuriorum]